MRRTFDLYGLVLCAVALTGCGGGSDSGASSAVPSQGLEARSSATDEPSPRAQSSLVAAEAHAAGTTKELGPVIRPLAKSPLAFARNAHFHVYAANGSRQRLHLDLGTKSYMVIDNLGRVTAGTFIEDAAEPGTYVFQSHRIGSLVNTARFRITADAVVGAFPFEKPWSDPLSHEVVPFIAARAFVTDPAQLDGAYNRFGISRSSNGAADSQILALRISEGGTVLEMCFDSTIYAIDACPTVSKRTYAITPSPDSVWTATSTAPADLLQFRMARIGGANVWLSGGYTDAAPNIHVFRVGLRETSDWPETAYIGASTESSWGTNLFSAANSVRTAVAPEGGSADATLSFASIAGPQGIRSLNPAGPRKYFAMQNGVLSVVVGTRNLNTAGYFQLNLVK